MEARELNIRMDKTNEIVIIDGATKFYFELEEIEELVATYELGIYNRKMRETLINETSSRSHLIFSVMIEITKPRENDPFSMGKLTFIDLAGSESLAYIGVDPERFIEGI